MNMTEERARQLEREGRGVYMLIQTGCVRLFEKDLTGASYWASPTMAYRAMMLYYTGMEDGRLAEAEMGGHGWDGDE